MNDIFAVAALALCVAMSYAIVWTVAWYVVDRSYLHRMKFLDNAITAREDFLRHTHLKQGLTTRAPVPMTEAAEDRMNTIKMPSKTFGNGEYPFRDGDKEEEPKPSHNRVRSVTDARR